MQNSRVRPCRGGKTKNLPRDKSSPHSFNGCSPPPRGVNGHPLTFQGAPPRIAEKVFNRYFSTRRPRTMDNNSVCFVSDRIESTNGLSFPLSSAFLPSLLINRPRVGSGTVSWTPRGEFNGMEDIPVDLCSRRLLAVEQKRGKNEVNYEWRDKRG